MFFFLLLGWLLPASAGESWTAASLLEKVDALARSAAQKPYSPSPNHAPDVLRSLDYDQYRSIRYRPDAALWRGESDFEVQFFHPGYLFLRPVDIYSIEEGNKVPLDFSVDRFEYGEKVPEEAIASMAERKEAIRHAGFRLHFPINRADYKDEVVVFLGASYFRLVGPGQVYGLSSRGLALDTAGMHPEEFPYFTRFWLFRPAPGDNTLHLIAQLDSPSVTGAYHFLITVADDVTVEIDKRIHLRQEVQRFGVAPLTSMFLFSDFLAHRFDDFRPRVHDSEGLQVWTGQGEWIWRPLANPRQVRAVALQDETPRGFGLVQRRRDFADYLDLEAEYHRRPSHWVEPLGGDWGKGAVVLVEIPADAEIHDNIVVFWEPETSFIPGDSLQFHYRLSTFDEWPNRANHSSASPLLRLIRAHQGWGKVPGTREPPPRSLRRYVIEFGFPPGETWPMATDPVAQLELSRGQYHDLQVWRLPDSTGWRASFLLEPDGQEAADMRLFLTAQDRVISETWNHVWYPGEHVFLTQ